MEQKRIAWMDGLKGLSCIFILLHHFIMGFYPAAYSGDYNLSHMRSQADVAFAQSPLAFFAIGDLWVSVFCMISGFVIAYQVFRMTQEGQLSKALLKRYPRLMLPVFFVSAFVFVMLQFGWFYNSQAAALTHSEWLDLFYHDKSGIIELFTDCLIDDWFVGLRTIYSNAFWMLKDLFLGSFVAYILAIMGKSLKKNLVFVYIFVCILYLSINSRMADFSFGVLLAFLFMQYGSLFEQKKKLFVPLGIVLLVVGFFLGAYPVAVEPTNGYRYLAGIGNFLYHRLTPYLFYHKLAVFALLLGIFMLHGLQKVLETKICLFLGKVSYAVYLIHIPVLFSLTALLFVKLYGVLLQYNLAALLALLISLVVIVALSWLFYHFIEKRCVRFTNWLVDKILK